MDRAQLMETHRIIDIMEEIKEVLVALINGITRACPHLDRPWLDMHPEPKADYQCNDP